MVFLDKNYGVPGQELWCPWTRTMVSLDKNYGVPGQDRFSQPADFTPFNAVQISA